LQVINDVYGGDSAELRIGLYVQGSILIIVVATEPQESNNNKPILNAFEVIFFI
jgi:hypothetical protein